MLGEDFPELIIKKRIRKINVHRPEAIVNFFY